MAWYEKDRVRPDHNPTWTGLVAPVQVSVVWSLNELLQRFGLGLVFLIFRICPRVLA